MLNWDVSTKTNWLSLAFGILSDTLTTFGPVRSKEDSIGRDQPAGENRPERLRLMKTVAVIKPTASSIVARTGNTLG